MGEMFNSTLTDSNATGGLIASGTEVGGLVGRVFVGASEASSITRSFSQGLLDTTASGVGGLLGSIETLSNASLDISEVFSASQVGTDFSLANQQGGGLIGVANTSSGSVVNLTNCYATGAVFTGASGGGFIGGFDFTGGSINIDFCYSASPIEGGSADRGGAFGSSDNGLHTISNSFWDTEVSGQAFPSGNGGFSTGPGGVTGLTTAELQDFTNSVYVGWDFVNVWRIPISGYPELIFVNP